MNRYLLKDFPVPTPYECFRSTIKARARGDNVLLSHLKKSPAAKSPQYADMLQVSLSCVLALAIELSRSEAFIQMFDALMLPLMNHFLALSCTGDKVRLPTSEESPEASRRRNEFLDNAIEDFHSMVATKLGPSWLAFDSVCRSEMDLEPLIVLEAWRPGAAYFIQRVTPLLEFIDPDGDIDQELESEMRNLWRNCTA